MTDSIAAIGQRPLPQSQAIEPMGRGARTAEDFEALVIGQMLAPMWQSVEVDEYFGGGSGEEVFRDLLVQEYGKVAAAHGGLGLAAHIRQEMLRSQEAKS